MVVCRDQLLELGLAPEEWTYSGRSLDGWAGGISRISSGEFSHVRRCSIIVTGIKVVSALLGGAYGLTELAGGNFMIRAGPINRHKSAGISAFDHAFAIAKNSW